jgi:hypothetical protein
LFHGNLLYSVLGWIEWFCFGKKSLIGIRAALLVGGEIMQKNLAKIPGGIVYPGLARTQDAFCNKSFFCVDFSRRRLRSRRREICFV